ncbi:unnamed protein product [Anisakis simplex]|uniref:Cadherin_C domain-containing protein n=1 Tax=Anisakis simplex TaxID=6269 RepID=A0A0M3J1A5_ANISI|nr:unnamed protein product [Anisakis simplex]
MVWNLVRKPTTDSSDPPAASNRDSTDYEVPIGRHVSNVPLDSQHEDNDHPVYAIPYDKTDANANSASPEPIIPRLSGTQYSSTRSFYI